MAARRRTAIRRITIERYRSIEKLDLKDIPDMVVLYGPNGSGKSNILRAVQLVFRALVAVQEIAPPDSPDAAAALRFVRLATGDRDADGMLQLRPDDFRYGDHPEIRVGLEIEFGDSIARRFSVTSVPFERFEVTVVFRVAPGGEVVRFWFERLSLDGALTLLPPVDPSRPNLRFDSLSLAREELERITGRMVGGFEMSGAERELAMRRQRLLQQIVSVLERWDAAKQSIEYLRRFLVRRLLDVTPAYRLPDGTLQEALHGAFLSEEEAIRDAATRLGDRLAHAGFFGVTEKAGIKIFPVDATRTYGEKQVRFRHSTHGDVSMRNLGTGEQQLVLMLAQRVITPYPIAQLEEPEAHLHTTLMHKLAKLLRESVDEGGDDFDVDQLWIATHHHLFALSKDYFDVRLDEKGATQVERRPRERALENFYEPSPYWDTLRRLVEEGMPPDTVVGRDDAGVPIKASQILESMNGDRVLANKFVESATRAFVISLTEDPLEEPKS